MDYVYLDQIMSFIATVLNLSKLHSVLVSTVHSLLIRNPWLGGINSCLSDRNIFFLSIFDVKIHQTELVLPNTSGHKFWPVTPLLHPTPLVHQHSAARQFPLPLLLKIETTFTFFFSERVPCEPDPCKNGQCIAHLDGTYFCNCYPGYTGRHCNGQLPAKFILLQVNQIIWYKETFKQDREFFLLPVWKS